jgi:hypothetical protein
MINKLFNLNNSRFPDNNRIANINFLNTNSLNSLYNRNLYKLLDSNHNFFNNRNLHNLLHLFYHLSDRFNNMRVCLFYLFYFLLNYNSLTDDLYFPNLYDSVDYLFYYLDNLGHLFYSLHDLDYWDGLLHDSIHYCVLDLNVVLHLSCISILDHWNYLLHYFLHLDYLRHLHCFLHDFLHDDWHFNDFLNNFLNRDENLSYDFDLLYLFLDMIDNFLDFDDAINFNNFLLHSLNLYDSRHLLL